MEDGECQKYWDVNYEKRYLGVNLNSSKTAARCCPYKNIVYGYNYENTESCLCQQPSCLSEKPRDKPNTQSQFKRDLNNRKCPALYERFDWERLSQGLRQMMAGNRKFALEYITRDDIAALTQDAARISGIPYVTDVDKEEVEKILNG